jgi:hypothetical protein
VDQPGWAQVIDVEAIRKVTEWALPGLVCPCCGTVTFAGPPPGAHAGAVSYGPVLNAAAVLLSCYGNVPPERAAHVMGMLLGVPVSAGWVDKAAARVAAQLGKAGFDEAMIAALTAEDVLAADETPVNVLDKTAPQPAAPEQDEDPEEKEKTAAGAPHVLIVRTPDGRLTFLRAIGSRRKDAIAAGIPGPFTGALITDGYTAYQHLLGRLAGIQQCARQGNYDLARGYARQALEVARRTATPRLWPLRGVHWVWCTPGSVSQVRPSAVTGKPWPSCASRRTRWPAGCCPACWSVSVTPAGPPGTCPLPLRPGGRPSRSSATRDGRRAAGSAPGSSRPTRPARRADHHASTPASAAGPIAGGAKSPAGAMRSWACQVRAETKLELESRWSVLDHISEYRRLLVTDIAAHPG